MLQGYLCALNLLDFTSDKQNLSANNHGTNISSSFFNVVQGKSYSSSVLDYLVLTSKAKAGSPMGERSPRRDEALQESALAHPLGRILLLVTQNSNQTNSNQH